MYPRDRMLTFERGVLIPGLINVHAHLELPPLELPAGNTNTDYASWVLNLICRKTRLTSVDYSSAANRNIVEIIRSGTTSVAEICTHGISSDLLRESGLRAVVYHEVIAMRPDSPISIHLPRGTALVHHGLSPHSPHTVSEQALLSILRHTKRRRIPLAMHVAETRDEVRLLQRKRNSLGRLYAAAGWDPDWAPRARSSFQYLDKLRILRPGFLAVHAVHADREDISILARSGASVVHCPRSNSALRVGTMNLRSMVDAGITVALGTDSLASAPTLNLWDEMRAAYALHRAKGITPTDVLAMATRGGAAALGLKDVIGTLDEGKRADCIVVPLPRRNTGDLCSDLLRETKSSIMTMVNGKVLHRQ